MRPRPVVPAAGRDAGEVARLVADGTAACDERLARLREHTGVIVAGPWTSEVGFELLYWIPMLRALELPQERLVALSRGGVDAWYAGLCDRYIDLYDHYSPDEVRLGRDRPDTPRIGEKQLRRTALDDEVLGRATPGLVDVEVLHPELMYRRFWAYWSGRESLDLVTSRVKFERVEVCAGGPGAPELELPERYVAFKSYFRDSLPRSESNRAVVEGLLSRLSRTIDVVVLSTGLDLDDHEEVLTGHGRARSLNHLVTPRNNLDLQTRVVAGAQALIATYGGFAYLGMLTGTPTFSLYSERTFNETHLTVADQAATSIGGSMRMPYDVTRPAEVDRLAAEVETLLARR